MLPRIGGHGAFGLLQRCQDDFFIRRQRRFLNRCLRAHPRPHTGEIQDAPLHAGADRPKQTAGHEPFGEADAFDSDVAGQRKFRKPFRFRDANPSGFGGQLPFRLADVWAAAQQVGGKPDGNFWRCGRYRCDGGKFRDQIAWLLPDQNGDGVHGFPSGGFERRNRRLHAGEQSGGACDIEFARDPTFEPSTCE